MNKTLLFCLCLLLSSGLLSQKGVTTFGLQVKPMFSSKYFDTGDQINQGEKADFSFSPEFGTNLGVTIRRGFTDFISLETGISSVRRNYTSRSYNSEHGLELEIESRFISYEIPVSALVFVRLGENLWMNGSAGICFDIYPSDTFSQTFDSKDTTSVELQQDLVRRNWLQMSLLVNYGFEWRTKSSGYFYLGASYHRPFRSMALARLTYIEKQHRESSDFELFGTYLTVDIRYFFHEDPERKKKKTKKPRK